MLSLPFAYSRVAGQGSRFLRLEIYQSRFADIAYSFVLRKAGDSLLA